MLDGTDRRTALDDLWARACARRVIHLWPDAPEEVRRWLDTGDPAIQGEAWRLHEPLEADVQTRVLLAARAARMWSNPAAAAQWAVAAIEAVAWAAAQATGTDEATEEAWRASHWEGVDQQLLRAQIEELAAAFAEHGLGGLRVGEAAADPWLAREVWRALGLPDFDVVEGYLGLDALSPFPAHCGAVGGSP